MSIFSLIKPTVYCFYFILNLAALPFGCLNYKVVVTQITTSCPEPFPSMVTMTTLTGD